MSNVNSNVNIGNNRNINFDTASMFNTHSCIKGKLMLPDSNDIATYKEEPLRYLVEMNNGETYNLTQVLEEIYFSAKSCTSILLLDKNGVMLFAETGMLYKDKAKNNYNKAMKYIYDYFIRNDEGNSINLGGLLWKLLGQDIMLMITNPNKKGTGTL